MNPKLIIVGIAAVAVIAVMVYSFIDQEDDEGSSSNQESDSADPITLTFQYDASVFVVTTGGKPIANGDYTLYDGDVVHIKSKSGKRIDIGYEAAWSDTQGGSGGVSGNDLSKETDVEIEAVTLGYPMTGYFKIFIDEESEA